MEKVSISLANSKMGKVHSVSLPPVISCNPEAPCRSACYARQAYRQYKQTTRAYDQNYIMATRHRASYFTQILDHLNTKKPRYFRWHVSGDIIDQDYFNAIKLIALNTPKTAHLIFTKQHHLEFTSIPANLTVIFSMWNDFGDTTAQFRRAWMFDTRNPDSRIPINAIPCQGNCEKCGICWHLPTLNRDVVFNKH